MSDNNLVNMQGQSAIQQMAGDPNVFDMVTQGKDLVVSPEIEAQVKALMGKITDRDTLNAKFVLDLFLTEERSKFRPFTGFLMGWTNGGALSGGGDEKIYFCPQKVDRNGETSICGAPLPPNLIKHGIGMCLACKRPSEDKNFIGEILFKLPMDTWPKVLERYFYRLECNTDIRICVLKGDLKDAAMAEQERQMHGDRLNKVRAEREWVRYRLEDLVKDSSAGATLQGRLRSFLNA